MYLFITGVMPAKHVFNYMNKNRLSGELSVNYYSRIQTETQNVDKLNSLQILKYFYSGILFYITLLISFCPRNSWYTLAHSG